jgi:hypothetical protein
MHFPEDYASDYTLANILDAADWWFETEHIGPALHEPTREVYRFTARYNYMMATGAKLVKGTGGATKAFEHAGGRRMKEIAHILGMMPIPGSLNLRTDNPFDWNIGYYRAQILDVEERGKGLHVPWIPRWARFYPIVLSNRAEEMVFAFRFEGESYPDNFVEVISNVRLSDLIEGDETCLWR